MYAIFKDGGRQYRVEVGSVVNVDLRPAEAGQQIQFNEVLFLGGEGEAVVGNPTVPGAKVVGEVTGQVKGKKLRVLHWRRRKASRCRQGHRQKYTQVAIREIVTGKENGHGA